MLASIAFAFESFRDYPYQHRWNRTGEDRSTRRLDGREMVCLFSTLSLM